MTANTATQDDPLAVLIVPQSPSYNEVVALFVAACTKQGLSVHSDGSDGLIRAVAW